MKRDALPIIRLIEQDMAEQAIRARRSADARRGLSDHEALVVYADSLTRWSERLRMALDGKDYLDREAAQDGPKWVDLFGVAPDFCGGQDVNEWLDEQRGDA